MSSAASCDTRKGNSGYSRIPPRTDSDSMTICYWVLSNSPCLVKHVISNVTAGCTLLASVETVLVCNINQRNRLTQSLIGYIAECLALLCENVDIGVFCLCVSQFVYDCGLAFGFLKTGLKHSHGPYSTINFFSKYFSIRVSNFQLT